MRTIVFVVFAHVLKIIGSYRLPMLADCTESDIVGHGNNCCILILWISINQLLRFVYWIIKYQLCNIIT